ncbi:MAG: amine dehydrogenase [Gammaproteobacteria bacterium]|nr:amine dehydrogenase [Gammaproteobacteria bacterium]
MRITSKLSSLLAAMMLAGWTNAWAELPVDPIPNVLSLDPDYPDTWIYAHDTNFFSLLDGQVVLLDVAAENRNYKGAIPAGQFASFIESTRRPELYVAETYLSRRTRGERTDVITIHDKSTLDVIDEIELPGGKRGQMVTHKHTLRFLDAEERHLAVYNFTPAESVTIVDVAAREILSEIEIPGCAFIYPTGPMGFSSLCSNGAMLTVQLDGSGQESTRTRLEPFFDIDTDPLFAKAVHIGNVAYFPTFGGKLQPIDLSGPRPVVGAAWNLVSDREAAANYRPGGWQIATGRADGHLYVLMHKDGSDGSHKNGGDEVWVFDVTKRQRVQIIKLAKWGVSIEVTGGASPYLAVLNADMDLDVYDANAGQLLRTIGDRFAETAFMLHAVQ